MAGVVGNVCLYRVNVSLTSFELNVMGRSLSEDMRTEIMSRNKRLTLTIANACEVLLGARVVTASSERCFAHEKIRSQTLLGRL